MSLKGEKDKTNIKSVFLVLFLMIIVAFSVILVAYFLTTNSTTDNGKTGNQGVNVTLITNKTSTIRLPDTAIEDKQTVVSLKKAIKILLADSRMSDWSMSNSNWKLIYADSDEVKINGLAPWWHIIIQGPESIVTADVSNGNIDTLNIQNLKSPSILKTDFSHMADSTMLMYNLTGKPELINRYGNSMFIIHCSDSGTACVYQVTYDDPTQPRCSINIKVNALTGEIIEGQVWQNE